MVAEKPEAGHPQLLSCPARTPQPRNFLTPDERIEDLEIRSSLDDTVMLVILDNLMERQGPLGEAVSNFATRRILSMSRPALT